MDNILYIVFNFSETQSYEGERGLGRFQVLFAFDHEGKSDYLNQLQGIEFSEKDHLISHLTNYMEETNLDGVKLLAVNDLNIGIESCHSPTELLGLFDSHGELLEPEEGGSKKSILSRLF